MRHDCLRGSGAESPLRIISLLYVWQGGWDTCAECPDERLTSGARQVTFGGSMHKLSLLVLAALLVTACGTEGTKPTGSSVPKRDLTLSGQFAQVDVASPIELRRPLHQTAFHALRRMRQPTHPFEPTIIPAVLNSTPAPLAAKPAAEPVTTVLPPSDAHE